MQWYTYISTQYIQYVCTYDNDGLELLQYYNTLVTGPRHDSYSNIWKKNN